MSRLEARETTPPTGTDGLSTGTDRPPTGTERRAPGPLLEVEHLDVALRSGSYTNHAVVDVSFEVGKGARVGIVGETGSGKSVTALSVLQLHDPRVAHIGPRSHIRFDGVDVLGLPDEAIRGLRGSRISMVFQDPMTSLNPVLQIGRQIDQVIRTHRDVDRDEARRQAVAALALVHLPDPERVLRSFPHQLSGGMIQRALIAMAIVCRPQLLIADEPTSALDVTVQAGVLSTFTELVETLGMSLLLISHDMGVISRTCDYVYVMYGGRIVEGGPTGTVLEHPRHPYTHLLLQCRPRALGPVPPRLPTIPGLQESRVVGAETEGCNFAPRCRFKDQRCLRVTPPLERAGPDQEEWVACHHWHKIDFGRDPGS
jgi:peptide/nickel transport system ATP-binding protein